MNKKQGTCLLVFTCIVLLTSTTAWSTTYYIDYVNGLNANSGLSKNAAWKVHPYMRGFTGTYAHQAGDRFVFKGGVTWPYTTLGMTIGDGGTSSAFDYYGVDKTWYAGYSWSKPVLDGGGSPHTIGNFMYTTANYITIDNFEMTNFYWVSGYGTSYIAVSIQNYVVIKNCFFHNWNHSSGGADDLQVVLGSTAYPNTGCVIDSCIFDGSEGDPHSGMAVYCIPTIRHCIAGNMSNGFLPNGSPAEVSGCRIGPINESFSGVHPNSIEQVGASAGLISIHHNVIFGATAICIFVGNPGGPAYIYNNLIYDSGPIPIQFDGRSGTGSGFVYNNTFVWNSNPIRNSGLGTPWTVTASNNHVIGDGASISPNTSNNLVQTTAQATTAGYARASNWKPTSAAGPTVNAGADLSSIFADDLLYVSRPQGTAWDIGAYEYVAGTTAVVSPVYYRQSSPLATIRLYNAGFSVTLPLSVKSPELTIVDLSGREVYRAMLNKTGESVYHCAWHGAPAAEIYFAEVKETSRNDGVVLVRTKFVIEK